MGVGERHAKAGRTFVCRFSRQSIHRNSQAVSPMNGRRQAANEMDCGFIYIRLLQEAIRGSTESWLKVLKARISVSGGMIWNL